MDKRERVIERVACLDLGFTFRRVEVVYELDVGWMVCYIQGI